VGLEYLKMEQSSYKKLDIELALPEGLGFRHNLPRFFKIDGLMAKTFELMKDRLKLAVAM
jgi:hypothetical protein